MGGLSSAPGALAVVSLIIQMADAAKQLCDVWTSIKDALEVIRTVIVDLELLSSVLAEMASEAQHTEPDTTLAAVLQGCTGNMRSLTAFTNNLEPGFCHGRRLDRADSACLISRRARAPFWVSIRKVL